jgi:hypothetical protein
MLNVGNSKSLHYKVSDRGLLKYFLRYNIEFNVLSFNFYIIIVGNL